MGFQDRDYAKPIYGGRRGGGGMFQPSLGGGPSSPGWLIGGSIVTTIIAVNVAIFAIEMLSAQGSAFISGGIVHGRYVAQQPGLFEMRSDLVRHGQVWRLVTAQYLHASIIHLLFNMIALHFLGRLLERVWSFRRFFVIYTMCGLVGNVFYTFVISPAVPGIGASGCIYGLLGMTAVMFPNMMVLVWGIVPVRVRTLAIILGIVSFFTIQTRGHNYGGEAVHLAGLVFGVWWAARGQHWWEETEWRWTPKDRRTRTKPSAAGFFQRHVQAHRAESTEIDRILQKVHERGIGSLSETEKRMLHEATERQRIHEESGGRTDRL